MENPEVGSKEVILLIRALNMLERHGNSIRTFFLSAVPHSC